MDDTMLDVSMRKFRKLVGATSQQQIENAVREFDRTSRKVAVKMVLTGGDIGLATLSLAKLTWVKRRPQNWLQG